MQSASLVLLSNQQSLSQALDVIANNVANSSTTGFKREGISFSSLLEKVTGGDKLDFVVDRGTYRDTSPGVISNTGNTFDLAIQGAGYFQIQTTQGTRYTRNGAFQVNPDGQLVNSSNQPVLDTGGQAITIPQEAENITISGDGYISAKVGTNSALTQLGKIGVVSFPDEQGMISEGRNLLNTTQTPTPVTKNVIVQGAIEESNVKPIAEISSLIMIQRSYEQANSLIAQEKARISDALGKLAKTTV